MYDCKITLSITKLHEQFLINYEVLCLANTVRFFTIWATREAQYLIQMIKRNAKIYFLASIHIDINRNTLVIFHFCQLNSSMTNKMNELHWFLYCDVSEWAYFICLFFWHLAHLDFVSILYILLNSLYIWFLKKE